MTDGAFEHSCQPAVDRAMASRGPIEQATGALMVVYGIDAQHAFELLRRRSQHTNTRLNELAAWIVAQLPRLGGAPEQWRTHLDPILRGP